jgi:hypothetical protein
MSRKYRFETEEHELFRESLRKFLQKEAAPYYDLKFDSKNPRNT